MHMRHRAILAVGSVTILAVVAARPAPGAPPAAPAVAAAPFAPKPILFVENRGQIVTPPGAPAAFYAEGRDLRFAFGARGVAITVIGPPEGPPSPPRRRPGVTVTGIREEVDPATGMNRWVGEPRRVDPPPRPRHTVYLHFVGASAAARPVGRDRAPTVVSFFQGPRPEWKTAIPTYNQVVYAGLWPGIDLVYTAEAGEVKQTFVVRPGADPARIRLAWRGATGVVIDAAGAMVVSTSAGSFIDEPPIAYQESGGHRIPAAAAYAIAADPNPADPTASLVPPPAPPHMSSPAQRGRTALRAGETTPNSDPAHARTAGGGEPATTPGDLVEYGFSLAPHDPTRPLFIDPAIFVYGGFFGGPDGNRGLGIAVDDSGSAYFCGETDTDRGDRDAYAVKVSADGTRYDYIAYVGGRSDDTCFDMGVDAAGNTYLTGVASSSAARGFPVTVGPDLTHNGGVDDTLVAKLDPTGTNLVYAGYLGGRGFDFGEGIRVAPDGTVYLSGIAGSNETSFPVAVGPDLTHNGGYDAYICKLKPVPDAPDPKDNYHWCGYVGGSAEDVGVFAEQGSVGVTAGHVAIDTAGNVYASGMTRSTEVTFPDGDGFGSLTSADNTHNGGWDAWAVKVRADGTGLAYAGYLGGGRQDEGYGAGVDAAGAFYFTGSTQSRDDFPVVVGPDLSYNGGNSDAFVAKVAPDGSRYVYAGFIGGECSGDCGTGDMTDEMGVGLTADADGHAYPIGWTYGSGTSFPAANGPDLTPNGPHVGLHNDDGAAGDGWVARVRPVPNAANLLDNYDFLGFIGGDKWDAAFWVALDPRGGLYVAGDTASDATTFPNGGGLGSFVSPRTTRAGKSDAFAVKVAYDPAGPTLTPDPSRTPTPTPVNRGFVPLALKNRRIDTAVLPAETPAASPNITTDSSAASARLDPRLLAAVEAAVAAERGIAPPPGAAEALAAVEAQGEGLDAVVYVAIKSHGPLNLGTLADKSVSTRWPLGEVVTLARIRLGRLLKAAAIDNVIRVEDAAHPVIRTDEAGTTREPDPAAVAARWAELERADVSYGAAPPLAVYALGGRAARARAAGAPDRARGVAPDADKPTMGTIGGDAAGGPIPSAGGGTADAWFDASTSHNTAAAWRRGWTGAGVRVGVVDTGVDFATPELMGTWATIDDPDSPYAGWPQALDSQGLYQYVQDAQLGSTGSATGAGGHVQVLQDAPATRVGATDAGTACFKRIRRPATGQPAVLDNQPTCDYRVPWRSRSGGYRFGPHPDPVLFGRYNGERPGVLLVDEARAGVYDTVYVDLDNDRNFVEEKPVTRADPISYRDMDGDGWADISGGLVYWISDGSHPPPAGYLWGDLAPTPAQGRLVVFLTALGPGSTGNHGTLCASNVAAQGVLPVPAEVDLRFRDLPGDGKPPYLVKGAAPGAAVVGIYHGSGLATEASYMYAVYGHEKDRAGDELHVLSNSYGSAPVDNEGWDNTSRLVDHLTTINRNLTFVFSAGNYGPGYGTIRAAHPHSAIKVAASTQMGSTGMNSITDTHQILWGDIVSFSSAGPGSDGTMGPHVAAGGAWASGASTVNARLNGRKTAVTWGGTSRAAPVTAGHVALVYQAFRQKQGRWPTWEEARSIVMAGAAFKGYEPFVGGAGVVDGGWSTSIAGGVDGLHAMPPFLIPGDYRGTTYAAFPRLIRPGEGRTATVTLHNPTDREIAVLDIRGAAPQRIGTFTFQWTSQATGNEDPPITNYPDMLALPDYVIPIPIDQIPADTELMAIRARIPLADSDVGLDYTANIGGANADNLWQLFTLQHTDIDGDGGLWHDRNQNKVVDRVLRNATHQIDGTEDVDWTRTEIDRWEFMRFGEDVRLNNNLVTWVHHPLDRWSDGLYIGLQHISRSRSKPTTTIDFEIDFYACRPWEWLALAPLAAGQLHVPAGGTKDIAVRVNVPADAPYGFAQGAIFATYARAPVDATDDGRRVFLPLGMNRMALGTSIVPGEAARPFAASSAAATGDLARLTIPVQINVAATLAATGSLDLVGARSQEPTLPYANGIVRGGNVWESGHTRVSGDWRFFPIDVPQPAEAGTRFVLRSRWDDGKPIDPASGRPVPRSDIDTRLFSPAPDRWSDPKHPDNGTQNLANPALFGPATVVLRSGSPNRNIRDGVWLFDTATDDYEDWVFAPMEPGLNVLMAHNQLVSGDRFDVPYHMSLDRVVLQPDRIDAPEPGCRAMAFTPSFALDGIVAEGFGLSAADVRDDQPIRQDEFWITAFTVTHGISIRITLDGMAGDDLDLRLYADANADGVPQEEELMAISGGPTADESIDLRRPPDRSYIVRVHGYRVAAGRSTFDLEMAVVQGTGVHARGLPGGGIAAGQTISWEVCSDLPPGAASGKYNGELIFGPPRVPGVFSLPITVQVPAPGARSSPR